MRLTMLEGVLPVSVPPGMRLFGRPPRVPAGAENGASAAVGGAIGALCSSAHKARSSGLTPRLGHDTILCNGLGTSQKFLYLTESKH